MNNKVSGKRPQFHLMIMTSLVMIMPASTFISNALHWKPDAAAPVLVSSPLGFSVPGPSTEVISKPKHQIQKTADGNLVKETFDVNGRRISKILSTSTGVLLNRWDFEPVSGRIVRYEVNDYRKTRLVKRRVARWEYSGEGGFFKTNQFFDAKSRPSKSFVESVNAKDIKYNEQWFDEKKRLISEKRWDPQTGNFASYLMIEYSLGGWSTRTNLDEKGKTLRHVLVTPHGRTL